MNRWIYKTSHFVLYVLLAVIAVALLLFFFGGDAHGSGIVKDLDAGIWQPAHTDMLLYLTYFLLGIGFVLFIVGLIHRAGIDLQQAPKHMMRLIVGILLLVGVFLLSWFVGSSDTVPIPMYNGSYDTPFWFKMADMFYYAILFMLLVSVFVIVVSIVRKHFFDE